ncbi:MAG: hypothetical protein PVF33_07125 [Candidatus Latescibacterota bacterium]|jgi:hypothetical protein
MLRNIAVYTVLLTLLIFVATSCDDTPQQNRSVISVASINDNVAPLLSDVVFNDGTSGDSYVPDYVEVIMENRPYSELIITDPGYPYGNFQVTSYTVEWTRTDGGSPALPNYTSDMSMVIPSGEFNASDVLIVTVSNKTNPPLSDLAGTPNTITMNAKVTFTGHEVGVDRETEVIANIGVLFGDVINVE